MSHNLRHPLLRLTKHQQKLPAKTQNVSVRLRPRLVSGALLWLLTGLLLSLSLSGCGLLSPKPPVVVSPPRVPVSPPALTQPIPSQTYSSSAQQDMSNWREKLTGTSTTSKP